MECEWSVYVNRLTDGRGHGHGNKAIVPLD